MKNKKLTISIICIVVAIIIGIITTILLINNKNTVDLNKLSSFEYYSGSSSVAIKFYGKRNQNEIDIEFTNFDSGNQNTESFTISTEDFIDLLKTSKKENCKKHTYEYQCGENDGCSHSSLTLNFDNDDKVCYEINSEIVEYFNGYSEIYNEISDDNEDKISQVDWTDLEITLNGKQYKYPFKVSNFITNGWVSESSEYEDLLNNTVSNSISKGYNYVVIKQNELLMTVYFDTTTTDTKILEANVMRLEIENTNDTNNNFDFYGLKFGTNEEQIENLFGTKNYEVLSDETNYTYRYFDKLENNLTATLELQVNIEKDKLDKFIISLY